MQANTFRSAMRRLTFLALVVVVVLVVGGCSDEQSAPVAPATSTATLPREVSGTNLGTARINITFTELSSNASFDQFTITNNSDAGFRIIAVNMYFNTAASDVILDMSPGRPGVGEGSWMYTEDEEQCGLKEWRGLLEGGKRIVLKWWNFTEGKTFRFGVDLDGQNLTAGTWREDVTGADIANSTMVVDMAGPNGLPISLTTALGKINDTVAGVTVEKPM